MVFTPPRRVAYAASTSLSFTLFILLHGNPGHIQRMFETVLSPQDWCKDASSNRAGDSHAHGVIATIAALRLSEGLLDHGEDGEGLAPRGSFCAPFFFEPLAEVPASESATLALDDCCVQKTEIRGLEAPFPGR